MSGECPPDPGEVNVFIVDDTLSLLSGILRGAGHRVRMANSGRRALAMVEVLHPELIMLDITMPEMDGYELCREIKARPATTNVPVIFISALSEPLDKVKAFRTGGVDYVTKPFDELLDLSAIEAGSVRLDLVPTDLVALVRANVGLNATLAAPKGIAVEVDHDGRALSARVDGDKVEQVLNNLIGNAVKFSRPGTRVRVGLREDGGRALFAVEDQGPSIPPEDLERIFEPFQTTSVKSTGGEKSTGLGLAIVKKIVAAHGGEVRAESEPGRGTTFLFTLPLQAGPPPA